MLTAPPSGPSLYFGVAVDMSGDYLVVGTESPGDDDSWLSGRVHIYRRVGGEWQLDATLTSPQGSQQGGLFGYAVSIASMPDGDVLVIGEPGRDMWARGNLYTDAGIVWMYERVGGAWVNVGSAQYSTPGAQFGFSVDTDGTMMIAGGPGAEDSLGATGVWRREAPQTWSVDHTTGAGVPGAMYGYSVAIAGDRALVGAPGTNVGGATNAGAAYVVNLFFDDGQSSIPLHDPTPEQSELFGFAVAASSGRYAVGSFRDDEPGGEPDSGAVHTFQIEGGIGILDATLRSPSPQEGAQFGSALAFSDDRLVIGERYREVLTFGGTLPFAGAMHLFLNIPAAQTWLYETSLYNFGESEQMGWSVGATRHFAAAGLPTQEDDQGADIGSVAIYQADLIFADGFRPLE